MAQVKYIIKLYSSITSQMGTPTKSPALKRHVKAQP